MLKKARLKSLALTLGFRWGITRVVWLGKRTAWKMPNPFNGWHNFITGINANISEAANWYAFNSTEPGDPRYLGKQLLCPVTYESWGSWLVGMQRAERELTEEEGEQLDLTPWEQMDLEGDDKHTNYGWLEGRIVKLDYGHFVFVIRWWQQEKASSTDL